ncbi:hypothetical protein OCK02_18585 [Rhizobium sp. TRM96647]|uniref:hypothetical protein n=1 Tax=unclassified Rhizobium TaxID=2613769 RepID=UPI0021E7BF3F|nr:MULTISPECIES: hypothetical protein [unclassified Rhizobium]MCV3738217.1 hypothetical protein [Rhizobium sp. TRM96647]MCV3760034.1 hypothetical protein [Rhizobium sp. TRM96650]
MIPSHPPLNVHYDPASKTALLQFGRRSTVLHDLPTLQKAEDAAREFAASNWGYVEEKAGAPPEDHPAAGNA